MKGENVCYRFEAGPLANALNDAFKNPKTNVVLLIEEINRGNAPAIFGEMFHYSIGTRMVPVSIRL